MRSNQQGCPVHPQPVITSNLQCIDLCGQLCKTCCGCGCRRSCSVLGAFGPRGQKPYRSSSVALCVSLVQHCQGDQDSTCTVLMQYATGNVCLTLCVLLAGCATAAVLRSKQSNTRWHSSGGLTGVLLDHLVTPAQNWACRVSAGTA